ncbi:MAG: glycosyltransferase [Rhodobiaceae bacterium]|nr:glycosyltransferase [Rhodobiaceae bacterium]MCC0053139.1 glycosyltransferase [Rhodobiaceae bacterium]
MRILLANAILQQRTGTEVVTIELAQALAARGHEVVVYTPLMGDSAEALRARNVRVTDSLHDLDFEAEVIHGNHAVELVHAMIRYPHAPGLFVCHDPGIWFSEPPDLARIRAYVGVCGLTVRRIEQAVPRMAGRVQFVPNAVDLDRFVPRPPLPPSPLRALALTKHSGHLDTLRAACARAGVALDILGPGAGQVVDDLPARLRDCDLVFATARMAIEAMAVGCATIVVDGRGLAGLATSRVAGEWRAMNFGMQALTRPVTEDAVLAEIARYDAGDAAAVSASVRAAQPLSRAVEQYERLYRGIIDRHAPVPADIQGREMSRLMQQWFPAINGVVRACAPVAAAPVDVSPVAAAPVDASPVAAPPVAATPPPEVMRAGFWNRLGRSIDKRFGPKRR